MPEWILISVPVLLAAILAAVGAIFLRLGEHGERLAHLEAQMTTLMSGHRVVDYGPSS